MSTSIVTQTDTAAAPLSLYHLLDPDVLANPYPLYQRLREEDPVHWDPFLHAWIVTRYADVVNVLHHFSADRTPTPDQLTAMGLSALNPIAKVMVKQMLFMDAPSHTRLRSLASSVFTPSRVEVLRSHIQEVADSLLDAVQNKGRMDLIAEFASPLPAIVTAEMLGVPVEDHEQLKVWSADFAEMLGNFQHNPERVPRVLRSLEDMTAYFRSAIQRQQANPREGLIHSLSTAEIEGDRLSEEEVIANCIVTMVGGQETTTNLIGNGLLSLLRNQDQLEKLRGDLSLIPSAVEELLRYESPSQHTARLAREDTELGGKQIRKHQAVIAVMAAGNRDPERFPDPDRLDITRKDNRHLAFGWAAHFCFGASLARIEAQVAFATILRRLPHLGLEAQPLVWRTNLGLRGLTALPITLGTTSRRAKTESELDGPKRLAPILGSGASSLSKTKRLLLEKYLAGEFAEEERDSGRITARPRGGPIPLSLAQEEIWRHEAKAPGGLPSYNESITMHRSGPLDYLALERSFNELMRRHEIWRTTCDAMNGQAIQVIHEAAAVSLPVIDLRSLPRADREAEALRVGQKDAQLPFDMKRGPLVRATLVTLDDEEHRLFITAHQSVVDGVSVYEVLPLELTSLYETFAAGKPPQLPELPIQFSDFAFWERNWLRGPEPGKQLAYWRTQLAGEIPALRWPNDRRRAPSQSLHGAISAFAFSPDLSDRLRQLGQQEEVTLFMTLLAGFAALLYFYTQQECIVVGTLGPAGRKHAETRGLLGYFLNPLALRLDLSGDPTFRELLQRAREVVLGALLHDDVPFGYVVNAVQAKPDAGRHPLFQLAISLAPPLPLLPSGWDQTPMDVESGGSKWDLYLELSERPSGMIGRAQYNPDLFQAETIKNTVDELQALLETASMDTTQRLTDLLQHFKTAAGPWIEVDNSPSGPEPLSETTVGAGPA